MMTRWLMVMMVVLTTLLSVGCGGGQRTGTAYGGQGHGGQGQWVPLGRRDVTFAVDHDTVLVTGNRGRFQALRVHVSGSPLEMGRIKVTFGNGQVFSPNVRHAFRQGAWTRRIDLPGQQRVIRKVEFWYRSVGKKSGRATVQLLGAR